jgi:hypothetical protein
MASVNSAGPAYGVSQAGIAAKDKARIPASISGSARDAEGDAAEVTLAGRGGGT